MVHGASRVGLKSLPVVNQTRVPEASEPDQLVKEWIDAFLSDSDRSYEVGETWGEAPRYREALVTEHVKRCEACTVDRRCDYAELLYLWIKYGVDLRVVCANKHPSQFPKSVVVQAERASDQRQHLDTLERRGVAARCSRSQLECVGNVFLVGVDARPSGLGGVDAVARKAGLAEQSRAWQTVVQSTAKERLVMDLRGLNRVSREWKFAYDSLMRIAQRYEYGDVFAVLDLSAAFHLIPVAKSAWSLLGLRLRDEYWHCTRLPFGYSAAPAICSVLTSELARLLEQLDRVKAVCCYVDDFFVLLRQGTEESYVGVMTGYLAKLGAVVAPEKCQFGTEVTFVGFRVRGTRGGLEIAMREEKRVRLLAELDALIPLVRHDGSGALEPAVEMLSGRLQWYWPALANSYAWLEPFHRWRRHASRLSLLPERGKEVTQWLEAAMVWWRARAECAMDRWTRISASTFTELAVVDASGPDDTGKFSYGGVLWRLDSGHWVQVDAWRGVTCDGAKSTQTAELWAILGAWERMVTGAGLVASDSTAAVTAAAKGYTRNYGESINERLRAALERDDQIRRVIWTPRTLNTTADAMSRPQSD